MSLFFHQWSNNNQVIKRDAKIKEHLLKGLAQYPKLNLFTMFSKWRENKKNNSHKVLKMIAVINHLFCKRAKRALNPPRITKNADEIMLRALKK